MGGGQFTHLVISLDTCIKGLMTARSISCTILRISSTRLRFALLFGTAPNKTLNTRALVKPYWARVDFEARFQFFSYLEKIDFLQVRQKFHGNIPTVFSDFAEMVSY